MRTAQICPTCATYTNAKCIIYDGPFLTNSGISPNDNLEYALGLIDGQLGVLANNILTILNNPPSLQSVTDIGNVTTNSIEIGNQLIINDSINGYGVTFDASTPGLSDNRTYSLPDDSGTIALTSDIPEPGWGLTGNAGTTPGTNFIGTTDNKDLVFKRQNVESLRIDSYQLSTPKSITAKGSPVYITAQDSVDTYKNIFIGYDPAISSNSGHIVFSLFGCQATIKADNVTDNRNLQLPDASGTLALEGYKVYSAFGSYSGGNFVVTTLLQDGLGATITWSADFLGTKATASSPVFTVGKTIVIATPYIGNSSTFYNNVGSRTSDTVVSLLSINTADGSISSSDNKYFFVEIRVYP